MPSLMRVLAFLDALHSLPILSSETRPTRKSSSSTMHDCNPRRPRLSLLNISQSDIRLLQITILLHPIFILHLFTVILPHFLTTLLTFATKSADSGLERNDFGVIEEWGSFDAHERPLLGFGFVVVIVALQAVLYVPALRGKGK